MRFSSIFALFLVFTSMLAAQEPMAWQQRTDVGSPGLYEGAAMAFDEQQGVMLHFGGSAAWTVIGALAYSTNNGTNWTCLDTPFSDTGFSEVKAIDAHNSQVLVCGKRFGDTFVKIYYSNDNGAVWHESTKTNHRLPNTTYVALNPHQCGHFWVATNGRSYARFEPGAFGEWQQQHFDDLALNDPNVSASSADADGDGHTNDFEFTAGLTPTDAQSRFLESLSSVPGQPAQMRLVISPRLADRTYTVKTTPSLTASPWVNLVNSTISDAGIVRTITDLDATGAAKFYYVEITKP